MRAPFAPILAGATLRDRLAASFGALAGVAVTGLLSAWAVGVPAAPLIVAPMGASAVLVFAVPASPLAQPWPVIGGNAISALIGVAVAHLVPWPPLAAALAVGLAILAMSLTRSLHPPGGASALLAVIGGAPVAAWGVAFALVPVALNAAILAACGWLFHRLSGHRYPHRPMPAAAVAALPHPEDLDAALADLGESFDIAREDLELLLARVAAHARRRGR